MKNKIAEVQNKLINNWPSNPAFLLIIQDESAKKEINKIKNFFKNILFFSSKTKEIPHKKPTIENGTNNETNR